ncbi:MAG TPA: isopentenyl-diphosphate delta-isomerase [Paenirhodobacter sp.]
MTDDLIPAWVDGVLTPVDKLFAHQRGLRHKAVSVFVMDGPRVLLQRRASGKYHSAGLWANTCCTHPHWDEPAGACAIRRLRQELGITGLHPVLSGQVEYRADVGGGLTEHEVVDIFLAQAGSDIPLTPDPAEVSETRWIDLYDLVAQVRRHPERFTRWLVIYLDAHMDQIFGPAPRR